MILRECGVEGHLFAERFKVTAPHRRVKRWTPDCGRYPWNDPRHIALTGSRRLDAGRLDHPRPARFLAFDELGVMPGTLHRHHKTLRFQSLLHGWRLHHLHQGGFELVDDWLGCALGYNTPCASTWLEHKPWWMASSSGFRTGLLRPRAVAQAMLHCRVAVSCRKNRNFCQGGSMR